MVKTLRLWIVNSTLNFTLLFCVTSPSIIHRPHHLTQRWQYPHHRKSPPTDLCSHSIERQIFQSSNDDLDNVPSDSEGDEPCITSPSLSRAQRKRLRLKKLKEKHFQVNEAKSHRTQCFIGPLLPESRSQFQKTESQPDPSFCDKDCSQTGTKDLDDDDPTPSEIDKHHDRESMAHHSFGLNSNVLTKTKRRKLAKKMKQTFAENQRRIELPFTAEVSGNELIITRAGDPVS